MRLSVVVPATDAPATLGSCLEAIAAGLGPGDELIVVEAPPGLAPAAARNDGASRAVGDVLVFVDADVVVHADALARLRAALADPSVDAVFGSYDDEPSAPGVVSAYRNLLHHHVHQQGAGEARTFWTGLGAIRRDVFVAAGGFDADAFPRPSVEDVELGARLFAAGARIVLDPLVQGTHLKEWRLLDTIRSDFSARAVPWLLVALREGSLPATLNLGWRHRASMACVVAALGAPMRRRPLAALPPLVCFLLLNRGFYALVGRRLGGRAVPPAVGLHALHHATAAAAVPWALVRHLTSHAPIQRFGSRYLDLRRDPNRYR